MPRIQQPNIVQLVDSKLAKPKIDATDAREVLGVIEADAKYSSTEIAQLKRLTALPPSRFKREDEFIPNPYDSEDGVTIKTNPKKWLETSLRVATATLEVTSTIPEVSFALSAPKEYDVEDFGTHISRELKVTMNGKKAANDGLIDFTYGNRHIKVAIKAGTPMGTVCDKIESALLRAEGTLNASTWFDPDKRSQTMRYEVL